MSLRQEWRWTVALVAASLASVWWICRVAEAVADEAAARSVGLDQVAALVREPAGGASLADCAEVFPGHRLVWQASGRGPVLTLVPDAEVRQ